MTKRKAQPRADLPVKAAIYIRVSSDDQSEEGTTSLEDQERACREYIEYRKYQLVGVWREDGIGYASGDDSSGKTFDKRPRWRDLEAACRRGEVNLIVFAKHDRLARKAWMAGQKAEQLAEIGCGIVLLNLQVDTSTPNGKFMFTMLMGGAEWERDTIIERMSKGQHSKAASGRWPSSPQGAPFGLRVEGAKRDARLVLDPDETATIRKATELVLDERKPLAEACQILNGLGMLPRGAPRKEGTIPAVWSPALLRHHLTRPALVGVVWWGVGRYSWKGRTGEGKYGDGVQIPDVPAVLTSERFEALGDALTVIGPTPEYGIVYPLSGRIVSRCDDGKHYNGIYRSDRDKRGYKCQGKRCQNGSPACSCAWLDADSVEQRVWLAVCDLLGDAERLADLARDYLVLESGKAASQADELAALAEQIERLEKRLTSDVAAYLRAGVDPGAVAAATKEIETELAALRRRQADVAAYQRDSVAQARTMSQVGLLAVRAAERLASADPALQAEVLSILGVQVTLADASRTPALEISGTVPHEALLAACDPTADGRPSSTG